MKKLIASLAIALFSANVHAVEPGQAAPLFEAKDQDGKLIRLADYKNQYVLLYFYPKDETPGCTKEACNLRDKFPEFKKKGIVILGVSVQDEKSHKQFHEKYHLPFSLLVDQNAEIAKKFGVSKYPVVGLLKRQSVLVGKDGKVLKFYSDVNPDTHTAEVLKDVEADERH